MANMIVGHAKNLSLVVSESFVGISANKPVPRHQNQACEEHG